jgi:hypothetical protein
MKLVTNLGSVSWITADGFLDLAELPIDSILRQTLSPEFAEFRSACMLLGSMATRTREEAGVYLIGLLRYYGSDLRRLEVIADELGHFPREPSADALLAELRRVKSSNTTRRYLDRVLRSLTRLPAHLVDAGLRDLADDTSFSPKMRAKFREAFERIRWGA